MTSIAIRGSRRQIGAGNYDIGHVFTTGSGVAYLGVVCDAAQKGGGTTGAADPRGDAFWIDYVAHEIGHQFGGDHTFNSGAQGSCNANNRNAATAYEPGSGSTIQAYAGICGASNLQANSDPHFHAISLEQITDFTAGDGAACATNVASPHAAPVIAPALADFIIPARTPFVLTGAAQGAAGGVLTYSWEQYDLGNANGALNNDPGNGPIIRSLVPSRSASRTIPRLDHLLAGTRMPGETLPTTNRNLNFRLTVRDTLNGYGTTQQRRHDRAVGQHRLGLCRHHAQRSRELGRRHQPERALERGGNRRSTDRLRPSGPGPVDRWRTDVCATTWGLSPTTAVSMSSFPTRSPPRHASRPPASAISSSTFPRRTSPFQQRQVAVVVAALYRLITMKPISISLTTTPTESRVRLP